MKRKILLSALLLAVYSISNAQLKVLQAGQVQALNQTLIFSNSNNPSDGIDVVGDNASLANGVDLIWGTYRTTQPNNPGLFTLQSVDGAYFSVKNNGKVGIFNNNPSCALEVGTVGTNYEVKINGALVLTSDESVKKNIQTVDKSLDKLKQLKSVTYNFKGVTEEDDNSEPSISNKTGLIEKTVFKPKNNKDSYGRNYYGFLAQDIQKLFPDLVYKDSAGMLGVDYIGIIPLLVNALNEQETKITDLESRLSRLENSSSSPQKAKSNNTTDETDALTYPVLDQNVPNPFNASTAIGFYLPSTIATASIYVYDMNGVQLKTYPIAERGKGNIIIQGSEFIAGMYLYALIADAKVIDTKRMILTK